MCGIAGIVGPHPDRDWHEWASLTAYRGPDALNVFDTPEALLCHNRLSIIDLSTSANQPMLTDDEQHAIVFNGEIFNFAELRKELEVLGWCFKTHSDTEVLLNGFMEWGESVLDKLDGMFAFAIWNRQTKKLFAARDHAGIKPFYYSVYEGRFVFGSEIKIVLGSKIVPNETRPSSVLLYLAYAYIPAPDTAYTHVRSLEPGEALWFDLSTGKLNLRRWWCLPASEEPVTYSFDEATEELKRFFSLSVQRRLISDVPIGAFLSGGVDSSVIVAEMARISGKKVKTFSIGYKNNPEYDESRYAEEVAANLGVEHETIYPEIKSADLDQYIDLIINQFDQPYGNATVILTHILTRSVRDRVTVGLVGDGGDELFGGYPRYWALGQQASFGPLVRLARGPVLALLKSLPETPQNNHLVRRIRRFFIASEADLGMAFEQSTRLFLRKTLEEMIQLDYRDAVASQSFLRDLFHQGRGSWLSRACYADQRSFLPFNLLDGADRMSMANSFELRLPFLDRKLMEFAAGLPPHFRIKGRLQKRILKEAYKNVLPLTVINRPKRGFNPPVWRWLKDNLPLLQRLSRAGSPLADYINLKAVNSMIERFEANMEDNSTQLWSLLVLERWLQRQH